jgi:hypothetical protein
MVAYIIWNDMTWWSKDIARIFFESRAGQQIDLGIGMKVIYYFLIGLTLLLLGLLVARIKRHALASYSDFALARARRQKQREGSSTLLRRKSSKFYSCPNPECKKVFQKPVERKDLSVTPARVYPACPHCGIDLEPVLASFVKESAGAKKTEMKIEDSASKIETGNPTIAEQVESSHKKSSKPAEPEKSQIAIENRKKLLNVPEPVIQASEVRALKIPQKSHSPRKVLKALKEATSNTEVRTPSDCLEGCSNFFGYLQSLPSGSVVPPGCYSCTRRVDCYMRVRAIVSVYVDQEPANVY